ncbi:MAG: hypothetical protein GF411_11535 [Candidatus Lokiarchaeota archaeon]|nr:hypothetical protein [Candidatus Lokiarchaeota archaeon]
MISKKILLAGFFFSFLILAPLAYPSQNLNPSYKDVTTPSQTFVSTTILIDESHTDAGSALWTPANASLFSSLLETNGYSSDTNFNKTIDSSLLATYDVLVLFFPQIALDTNEVTAVHDFVDNGGGLLLVGIEEESSSWQYSPQNLNPISEQYGILFQLDKWTGTATDLEDHHVTHNMTSIHSNSGQHAGCTLSVSGSATSIIQDEGDSIVAVSTSGSGRIVAVGSLAPFLMYYEKTNLLESHYDHHQFSVNVIDWLSNNPERAATIPERNVIYAGSGPDLSPAEVESYELFTGIYHEHTTHSDGQHAPADVLYSAMIYSIDFIIPTDHSYDSPTETDGITGAEEIREIAQENGLDIKVVLGAELSRGIHSAAFPLTENVYTASQQQMVNGAHSQSAIIGLCHPTIAATYAVVYEDYDTYGYDFIEVDNSGFFYGAGEDGFTKPFMGAADFHSRWDMDQIMNAIFVETPSGPNGTLSDADIVDAVVNSRVVIIDKINSMIYGKKVWVDRWLALEEEAESSIESATSTIEQEESNGASLGLARLYLSWAEQAYSMMSISRSLQFSMTAQSSDALGVNLEVTEPSSFVFEEDATFDLVLSFTNNLDSSLSLETSVLRKSHMTITSDPIETTIPVSSSSDVTRTAEITGNGYTELVVSIYNFTDFGNLTPVLLRLGGYVDAIEFSESVDLFGTSVAISVPASRRDYNLIRQAVLRYTDGGGIEQSVNLKINPDYLVGQIDGLITGAQLEISVDITDYMGRIYTLTTTYTVQQGLPVPPILLIVVGIGAVAVVVVVVIYLKHMKK